MNEELETKFQSLEREIKSIWHEVTESKTERTDLFRRVGILEVDIGSIKADIKNLCKSVDNLTNTIKWGLGIFVTVSIFVAGVFIKQ